LSFIQKLHRAGTDSATCHPLEALVLPVVVAAAHAADAAPAVVMAVALAVEPALFV
jgi:hypothetical protein